MIVTFLFNGNTAKPNLHSDMLIKSLSPTGNTHNTTGKITFTKKSQKHFVIRMDDAVEENTFLYDDNQTLTKGLYTGNSNYWQTTNDDNET